ncbi:hypothetical protein PIB30_065532, partial [Stylosanthes scabra]|nr:hypothetical protein [Stylosanthes scabra]
MNTTKKHNNYKLSVKRATRRSRRKQSTMVIMKKKKKQNNNMKSSSSSSSSKVSQKLEALKNLIPSKNYNNNSHSSMVMMKPTDRLFQETADYIISLKTMVVILQNLIEFYGNTTTTTTSTTCENNSNNNENVVM